MRTLNRLTIIGVTLLSTLSLSAELETDRLINIAHNYLAFIHDVGSACSVQSDDPRIEALFAENLTKIDNRSILFANNRQALLPQMQGFEKEYNPASQQTDWTVDKAGALIIPSHETNSVVVYFEWIHRIVGRGTTTVILQCNDDEKIECVVDVWAKVS